MISKAVSAALLVVGMSGAAAAQGFSGGDLGIEIYTLSEDDDLGHTTYFGGGTFEITPGLAVEGDFGIHRSNGLSTDATNTTAHGIYNIDGMTAVGVFLGRDWQDGADTTLYGVEATTQALGFGVEGFAGLADTDETATVFGASGDYELMNGITFTGDVGLVSRDGSTANRLSAGAEYALGQQGPRLYGEIGRVGFGEDSPRDSATFVGLGARIDFGPASGTTFGRRSLLEVIPGY